MIGELPSHMTRCAGCEETMQVCDAQKRIVDDYYCEDCAPNVEPTQEEVEYWDEIRRRKDAENERLCRYPKGHIRRPGY